MKGNIAAENDLLMKTVCRNRHEASSYHTTITQNDLKLIYVCEKH